MNNIIYSTDNQKAHFVGFHDISPWNSENNLLALHRTEKDDIKIRTKDDYIEIVIWCPKTNIEKVVGKTNCWNWQQGSRLQWLPNTNKIIYNSSKDNKLICTIYDYDTEDSYNLPFPIYSISFDGKKALTYNFHRLGKYWKGYGYVSGIFNNIFSIDQKTPKDDGIFLVNLDSQKIEMLFSFEEFVELKTKNDTANRFFTHATFNHNATKFCFFERFHTKEGALYSKLFVYSIETKKYDLIGEGKFSHFDWIDNENIMVWSRPSKSFLNTMNKKNIFSLPIAKQTIKLIRKLKPSLKSKITKEVYKIYNLSSEPKETRTIGKDLITSDGHPMFHPNKKHIFVNDTYPDENKIQTLMLFDIKKNEKTILGQFNVPDKFIDSDLKCDLHPRFNNNGDLVCIDSAHSGKRQVYILTTK
ncbi:hypothetical protein [Flammeovirga sp. SubArs3]|uniref:hypothetical protein n=1 Tax=Flammeovirga sp. SubArs3 TaxID=2995316 RepID=UPI00248ADD16|nr:hypothetical protein [Flammeovirga sp. SubArs3]